MDKKIWFIERNLMPSTQSTKRIRGNTGLETERKLDIYSHEDRYYCLKTHSWIMIFFATIHMMKNSLCAFASRCQPLVAAQRKTENWWTKLLLFGNAISHSLKMQLASSNEMRFEKRETRLSADEQLVKLQSNGNAHANFLFRLLFLLTLLSCLHTFYYLSSVSRWVVFQPKRV